jgi:hypothetical protein
MMNLTKISAVSVLAAFLTAGLFALPQPNKANAANPAAASRPETRNPEPVNADDLRIQGEQRFRTNCGRCHMAPHKFPTRMMATIIRHMRVRATLTDQDMRFILGYMTQ